MMSQIRISLAAFFTRDPSHTTRNRLKVDYKLTREVKSQLSRSRMSTYI